MSNPKISYIAITARNDYPTVGLPNLHLFDPTLKTLANQTFKDFEYIVVDLFYDERKDYFKDHNNGLRIKHIPCRNIWSKHGLVQTCHQFNEGIIRADGELLFFDADSSMLHQDLMANLWKHYQDGQFVSLGFGSDVTFAPELYEIQVGSDGVYNFPPGQWQGTSQPSLTIVPTDWIKNLGYGYEGKIIMDHRYRKLFEHTDLEWNPILPEWYYGISTCSLEAALKINGFDQLFDGDPTLNDCDYGNRLVMAGYKKLAMFRDSYIVEAYAGTKWHDKMRLIRPEVKCNWALLQYSKLMCRYRANEGILDPTEVVNRICKNKCNLIQQCRQYYPYRAPFWSTKETEFVNYWLKHGINEQIDLEIERELQKSGEEHVEGTYVNI